MNLILKQLLSLGLIFLVAQFDACSQTDKTMSELLGFDADEKLLILHADDVGMSHSVNMASIEAMEKGYINSASIMVPCPWFNEIVLYARKNPEKDLGLHLTLTAEWNKYKWGGILNKEKTPSLYNKHGYFYSSNELVYEHANLEEVEAELRAQIDRALAEGINVTHFDSHMGTLFYNEDFFQVYLKLSEAYNIPIMLPYQSMRLFPNNLNHIKPKSLMIDQIYMANDLSLLENKWEEYYLDILENMNPGIHVILVHLGYDNDELQAVCIDHPDYGSAWREADMKVLSSEKFKQALIDQNIRLITWKELHERHASINKD